MTQISQLPLPGAIAADHEDASLIEALRRGDEVAFQDVVDRYHQLMLRVASNYVPSRTVAEEVVQETWLGVIKGIHRFEGRSRLKTWIFRILVNRARTRGVRESRSVPFSSLVTDNENGALVDPSRFGLNANGETHWTRAPAPWPQPEQRLIADETRAIVAEAVDQLPNTQRTVITLRDLQGWEADEVCSLLDISSANQRVLLHRARTKVRKVLARYLAA